MGARAVSEVRRRAFASRARSHGTHRSGRAADRRRLGLRRRQRHADSRATLAARAFHRRRQFGGDARARHARQARTAPTSNGASPILPSGPARRRPQASILSSATPRCTGWIDHATLFPRLMGIVARGGALAVQMPSNFHGAVARRAARGGGAARAGEPAGRARCGRFRSHRRRTISRGFRPMRKRWMSWTTEYLHVLPRAGRATIRSSRG